jgi:hypothetical protein
MIEVVLALVAVIAALAAGMIWVMKGQQKILSNHLVHMERAIDSNTKALTILTDTIKGSKRYV